MNIEQLFLFLLAANMSDEARFSEEAYTYFFGSDSAIDPPDDAAGGATTTSYARRWLNYLQNGKYRIPYVFEATYPGKKILHRRSRPIAQVEPDTMPDIVA